MRNASENGNFRGGFPITYLAGENLGWLFFQKGNVVSEVSQGNFLQTHCTPAGVAFTFGSKCATF